MRSSRHAFARLVCALLLLAVPVLAVQTAFVCFAPSAHAQQDADAANAEKAEEAEKAQKDEKDEKDDDDIFAELDEAADARGSDDDDDEDDDSFEDYGFDDPESIGFGVEELVVTGKASEASSQAIPEAITEFSQSDLDKMDISNVEGLSLNTPSMHIGKFGNQPIITLRGVGAANITTVGTPGVGFQVDGVHQGRPSAAAVRIYDIEDVRVYKGPMGNDGGYMTNGGRIAVRNMRPQEDLDVMGDIQYGSYDQILLRGAVNVPILPDGLLMSRGTITYENRDGYQENKIYDVRNFDADDANELISRFQLRSLLADESVELLAIGGYNFQKGIGPARYALTDELGNRGDTLSLYPQYEIQRLIVDDCPLGGKLSCRSPDPRVTYQDEVGFQDNHQANFTGQAHWDMPYFQNSEWVSDLRLSAIGGWIRTDRAGRLDVDGTNQPSAYFEQDLSAKQGSIEVFVERPDVERFDFKIGGYYLREDVSSYQCLDSRDYRIDPNDISSEQDLLNQSIAGYGSLGYRIFDNLRVTGSARYSSERKEAQQENLRYAPEFQAQSGIEATRCATYYQKLFGLTRPTNKAFVKRFVLGGSFDTYDKAKWNKLTYGASAEWDVTDWNAIAFSFSTGFKPGGFSLGADPAAGSVSQGFGPEDVYQYQLVSKNQLWDNKIQANLTLFWTDYDPFQVCQIIGVQYKCTDDGRALSRGIELELVATPIEGVTLNGHFNYLDTQIDRYFLRDPTEQLPGNTNSPYGGPIEDLSGNSLEKAPRFAGSFGVQYDWDVERWGVLSPRAQMQTQSRTYYRVFNKEEFSQGAFVKLDLSLEWQSEDGVYSVRGFVNNVTDVDVLNFLFVGPANIGGPTLGYYLPPRTWGIRVGITTLPGFLR